MLTKKDIKACRSIGVNIVIFAQALSSPISGILGDKYDRTHIVAFGCFLWGIMTTAIGFSTSIHQVCSQAC